MGLWWLAVVLMVRAVQAAPTDSLAPATFERQASAASDPSTVIRGAPDRAPDGGITAGGVLATSDSRRAASGQALYRGICAGCVSFDAHQTTLTIPPGTTVTGVNGYGSYLNNRNPSTGHGTSGNGVNYFSVQICGVQEAACWANNNILIDNARWEISDVKGVQLNAAEYDFDVTSPDTNVQGPTLTGSSLVQPKAAVGFTVGSLSTQDRALAKWTYAFVTQDGVAANAFHIGALDTGGVDVPSQPITFNYFDARGKVQAWIQQVLANGDFSIRDGADAHAIELNAVTRIGRRSGSAQLEIDSAAGQPGVLQWDEAGAGKWQIGKLNSNCFFAYDIVARAYVWQMCSGGTFTFDVPVAHSAQTIDKSYSYSVPAAGDVITIARGSETAIVNPRAALASLTIVLPGCDGGYDGSIVRFSSTRPVRALTVRAASGALATRPASLLPGAGHGFLCRGADTSWYMLY